jgi:2-amino-4-hydroxy-6-hydroxymethyldihydropteridine diphosphokinase
MAVVYLGLGSNLGNPIMQIRQALDAISALQDTHLERVSSFYCSRAMTLNDDVQADYINAVCCISTRVKPQELLAQLQRIETKQGRQKTKARWQSRTLDIDILLYDQLIIKTETLVIPHYGLCEREFVLYPLVEIAPEICLPQGESLQDFIKNIPLNGLRCLEVCYDG